MEIYDLIIVGGGPIGLAAGIEAKRAGLNYLILEKGCLVNSLFNYPVNMTFFSTSEKLEIGDVPFVTIQPKPKRAEALEYYRRVQKHYNLNIRLFEEVLNIHKKEKVFTIRSKKANYQSGKVVIATGFYDIPVYLNVPGEELPKVKHYYDDPHYYANQNVAVIGASNSSVDAALETYRKGAKVTLIVRGSEISPRVKYWVRPDIENRIADKEIDVYYHSHIVNITEQNIDIRTPQGIRTIPNDFVLALTGYRPNFEFLKKIGVEIDVNYPNLPHHDTATMQTNIEGLYLAGVVCGGLNTHLWFIENSRIHARQIVEDIVRKTI